MRVNGTTLDEAGLSEFLTGVVPRWGISKRWSIDDLVRIAIEGSITWPGSLRTLVLLSQARGAKSVDDVLVLHGLGMADSELRAYGTAQIKGVDTIVELRRVCDGYTARKLHRDGFRGAEEFVHELGRRAYDALGAAEAELTATPVLEVRVREQGHLVRLIVDGQHLRVEDAYAEMVDGAAAFAALGGDPTRVGRIQDQWYHALTRGEHRGVITGPLARRARLLRQQEWAGGVIAGQVPFFPAPHERVPWRA